MKKLLSCVICFSLILTTLTACNEKEPAESSISETVTSEETSASATDETTEATSASEESEVVRWFTFNPKVTSTFASDIYGQIKVDAWFNLVDAVMAGEDTFECPDKHTYLWVIAEFPDRYFPVLHNIIKTPDNYLEIDVNGTAPIEYKVSKEEAASMIADFTQLVEDIINENVRPEYGDFEKALALYNYFATAYTYDYDTMRAIESDASSVNYTCSYRLMSTKTGVCSEIAKAYSYLLMQLGMEATTVCSDKHEWSLIKLGDDYYHIDPTWVLNDWYSMEYFMMTDEQRCNEGDYNKDEFVYVGDYHPEEGPDYSATNDVFSSMWDTHVSSFDPETDTMEYSRYIEAEDDLTYGTFDYSVVEE